MHRQPFLRRGSCGLQILVALAVLGLILLVVGAVGLLTSGASSAVTEFQSTLQKLQDSATVFEAPATRTIEFKPGAGVVMLSPDGKVGDKRIGSPPSSVTIDVKVTGPDGSAVSYEPNRAPRNPAAPIEIVGFFQIKSEGAYTVEVNPSDGTTPVAILVGSGSNEEVESMMKNMLSVLSAGTGGCLGICGVLMALGFGIPALIIWRRKRNTPADPIATL